MYKFINSGYEAVLAQRTLKIKENILRNFISNIGYNIISKMSDTNIPKNVGEYRMISEEWQMN